MNVRKWGFVRNRDDALTFWAALGVYAQEGLNSILRGLTVLIRMSVWMIPNVLKVRKGSKSFSRGKSLKIPAEL